jgi:hypothetical protein
MAGLNKTITKLNDTVVRLNEDIIISRKESENQ